MNLSFFLSVLAIVSINMGHAQSVARYSRVAVPINEQNIHLFHEIGIETDHGSRDENGRFVSDVSANEIKRMSEKGLSVEVLIDDVNEFYVKRNKEFVQIRLDNGCYKHCSYPLPKHFKLGKLGGFYGYNEFLNDLDSMHLLYPDVVTLKKPIGSFQTYEGRPIYYLELSLDLAANPNTQKTILYTALHHAREPQSLSQLMYYMWYLLENYQTDPHVAELLEGKRLYFVPMINPDGYVYNETTDPFGGGLWRKNRSLNADGTRGVDLNRNYAYEWGFDDNGSSPFPDDETYRGTAPFSEPESQAIKFMVEQIAKPSVVLNYHGFGNLLLYPWGYGVDLNPEFATFTSLADAFTECNNFNPGFPFETVGYFANGGADDWIFGRNFNNPAFSFTPEVGSANDGFWPQINRIIPLAEDCLSMNLSTLANVGGGLSVFYEDIPVIEPSKEFVNIRIRQNGKGSIAGSSKLKSLNPGVEVLTQNILFTSNVSAKSTSLQFQLSLTGVKSGSVINFVHELSYQGVLYVDTLAYEYFDLSETILTDDFSSLDNWTTDTWGIQELVLGNPSATDSPFSSSQADLNSSIISVSSEAQDTFARAYLQYDVFHAIEKNYDFGFASIIDETSGTETYLCAPKSKNSTEFQGADIPIYDGNTLFWDREIVDITNELKLIDGAFKLKFGLSIDGVDERDGIYIDNVKIVSFRSDLVSSNTLVQKQDIKIIQEPGQIRVEANEAIKQLSIYDMTGKIIFHSSNEANNLLIQTGDWSKGIYLISHQTAKENMVIKFLVN